MSVREFDTAFDLHDGLSRELISSSDSKARI